MSDQVDTVAEEDAADDTDVDENTVVALSESEPEEDPVNVVHETLSDQRVEDAADVAPPPDEAQNAATDAVAEEVVDDGATLSSSGDDAEAATGETKQGELPSTDASPGQKKAEKRVQTRNQTRVRLLSVGQEISGTVKRITDFGAFVDIGVGRDGLIHISELSVRRVGKVTDILTEGQEISAWIKKLDRERNRISLTLIDPSTKTIRDLVKGEIVEGTVTRILPYGAFVDIGIGRDALLHVREMGEGYVAKPEDVVQVGEKIETRVIELSRRRGRVDLSLKGLRPEPEAEPEPQEAEIETADDEESSSDPYEELEVLSPMELAFKKAMEAEDMESVEQDRKQQKRNRRSEARSIQDEIVSRTLTPDRK
jgi:transcriptional accessory protein Tex/SPT6